MKSSPKLASLSKEDFRSFTEIHDSYIEHQAHALSIMSEISVLEDALDILTEKVKVWNDKEEALYLKIAEKHAMEIADVKSTVASIMLKAKGV
jgi:hypothetical protein